MKRAALQPCGDVDVATVIDFAAVGHEQTLTSAVLNGETLNDISAGDFSVPHYRTIFGEAVELKSRGSEVNVLSVTDALREKGKLDSVGGAAAVTSIAIEPCTPAILRYAIDCVRENSLQRRAGEIGAQLKDGNISAAQAVERLAELTRAASNGSSENFPIADLLAFDAASDPSDLLGNRWGCEGGSILWAGGSGYGKSTLAMHAGNIGRPVSHFSESSRCDRSKY